MNNVVWKTSGSENVLNALYPTDKGLVPIGYAIEKNGGFIAISHSDPNNPSDLKTTKSEAAQWILQKSSLC